jgi:hypothetical protein
LTRKERTGLSRALPPPSKPEFCKAEFCKAWILRWIAGQDRNITMSFAVEL